MADGGYATRRAHPRQQVAAFVDYSGLRAQTQRVQNISLGGICIHTEVFEEVGSTVDLVVTFPSQDARFASVGEVVWVSAELGDMGIRFIDLDDARRDELEGYLARAGE